MSLQFTTQAIVRVIGDMLAPYVHFREIGRLPRFSLSQITLIKLFLRCFATPEEATPD